MAGLLAWAADVVGAGNEDDSPNSIPLIFTPEQQKYALDLDSKAASLSDISQRRPCPPIERPFLHPRTGPVERGDIAGGKCCL